LDLEAHEFGAAGKMEWHIHHTPDHPAVRPVASGILGCRGHTCIFQYNYLRSYPYYADENGNCFDNWPVGWLLSLENREPVWINSDSCLLESAGKIKRGDDDFSCFQAYRPDTIISS